VRISRVNRTCTPGEASTSWSKASVGGVGALDFFKTDQSTPLPIISLALTPEDVDNFLDDPCDTEFDDAASFKTYQINHRKDSAWPYH